MQTTRFTNISSVEMTVFHVCTVSEMNTMSEHMRYKYNKNKLVS